MEDGRKEEEEGMEICPSQSKRSFSCSQGKITEAFPVKKARRNHEGKTGTWRDSDVRIPGKAPVYSLQNHGYQHHTEPWRVPREPQSFFHEKAQGVAQFGQGRVLSAAARNSADLQHCKDLLTDQDVKKGGLEAEATVSGRNSVKKVCLVPGQVSTEAVLAAVDGHVKINESGDANGGELSMHIAADDKPALEDKRTKDLHLSQFVQGHASFWCRDSGLRETEHTDGFLVRESGEGKAKPRDQGVEHSKDRDFRTGIAALENDCTKTSQLLFGEMNGDLLLVERHSAWDIRSGEQGAKGQGSTHHHTNSNSRAKDSVECGHSRQIDCMKGRQVQAAVVFRPQHLNEGLGHFGHQSIPSAADSAVHCSAETLKDEVVVVAGPAPLQGQAGRTNSCGEVELKVREGSLLLEERGCKRGHDSKVMIGEVEGKDRCFVQTGGAFDSSFSPGDSFWDELIEVEQQYVRGRVVSQDLKRKSSAEAAPGHVSALCTPEAPGDGAGMDLLGGRDEAMHAEGNVIVSEHGIADRDGGTEGDSPLPVRQISFSPLHREGSSSLSLDPLLPAPDFAFPVPKMEAHVEEAGSVPQLKAKIENAKSENGSPDACGRPSSSDPEWWGPSVSAMKRCHAKGGSKSAAITVVEPSRMPVNEIHDVQVEMELEPRRKATDPFGRDLQLSVEAGPFRVGKIAGVGREGAAPGLMRMALLPSEKIGATVATSTPDKPPGKLKEVRSEGVQVEVTPSKTEVSESDLQLSAWLPSDVAAVYAKKGVTAMYKWQSECLQQKGVLEGKNLVYCASTSAGKSLVSEIVLVRRLMSLKGKTALLVLPYVALCSEKAAHLEALLEPLGKRVRSFFGFQGGSTLPKDTAVAVCTIEKANSLVNKLLEEGRLFEIALVIIDELHMVGDADRGYLLELLLTKLRYSGGGGESSQKPLAANSDAATSCGRSSSGTGFSSSGGQFGESLQIVGMSATMPNVEAISKWLQASLYQTDFRPVPLDEYMKIGNGIYDKKWKLCRMLRKEADYGGKDPDHIVELCHEVVREGHSVLVFCSSRKGCETASQHIARLLMDVGVRTDIGGGGDDGPADGLAAVEELKKTPAGLDPVLAKTVPAGVAHHHAGLTGDERDVIEASFKRGVIRVLCATSTLAAGVNLPARRVIFRHPLVGRDFLDGTRYRQMAGRAGRAGIDTKGESILILRPEQQRRAALMLEEGCQPLQSCLTQDRRGMTRTLLEVVAGGLVQTAEEVQRYVRCTLLAATKPFEEVVKPAQEALRWLCAQKFVEWEQQTKMYTATPLGRAAFGSSLTPEEALTVFDDLAKARQAFVLASDLHVLYQVTPIYVGYDPDWGLFYRRFVELPPLDQKVGNFVGVTEAFLMRMAHGGPMMKLRGTMAKNSKSPKGGGALASASAGVSSTLEETLRVCRRFFVTLILSQLIQEVPLARVCDLYEVPKGTVQGLQDQAGRFAAMVAAFCERLGWQDMEALVKKFQNRVCFGVRSEIVDLTQLPYVKAYRARALYRAGFRTPQAVAEASPQEIAKALAAASFNGHEGQGAAGRQRVEMMTARKIINGARKKVLEHVEEARTAAFSALRALGLAVPADLAPQLPNTHSLDANPSLNEPVLPPLPEAQSSGNENHPGGPADGEAAVTSPPKKRPETDISGEPLDRTVAAPAPLPLPLSPATAPAPPSGTEKGRGGVSAQLFGSEMILRKEEKDLKDGRRGGGELSGGGRTGPVDVDRMENGFARFYEMWGSAEEFVFDLHVKRCGGGHATTFELEGIAVALPSSPVYYVNLSRPPILSAGPASPLPASRRQRRWLMVEERWEMVAKILEKAGTRKVAWDMKNALHALRNPTVRRKATSTGPFGAMGLGTLTQDEGGGTEADQRRTLRPVVVADMVVDVRVVVWILAPDEESNLPAQKLGLEQTVVRKLPADLAAAAAREGRWVPPGGRVAHNGCCRRAAQVRALHSVLWKMLPAESLLEPLSFVEMPLVKVLASMEENGIAVDMGMCQHQRQVIERKLLALHASARFYSGGVPFSLSSPAEVSDILYRKLGLPVPPGCAKGKNHPSTDKQALEFLKDQHPLVGIIMEHRSLSKLLNTTLGQIACYAKPADPAGTDRPSVLDASLSFIFGRWLQTSTSTGRLSMEDPNLQCVENAITFMESEESISATGPRPPTGNTEGNAIVVNPREIFVPSQPGWVLLSADYSQIELRLMAHFSKDRALIDLLTSPSGDVFRMIASRWAGLPESAINDKERNRAKRLTYGILYGMGVMSLAESMSCTAEEAQRYSQQFLRAFPGVARWIEQCVDSCRQTGHIATLAGRRRYLEKINDKWRHSEQARAERQAVNSICQGSAADLIKHAMILLHSALQSPPLAGKCRLLLQIHDELLLEVDMSVLSEAARAVQTCMEGAATLQVPLRVKLQSGSSWGSLQLYDGESLQMEEENVPGPFRMHSPTGRVRVLENDVDPLKRGG